MRHTGESVTGLLHEWSRGSPAALDELIPRLESELKQMAVRYMDGERDAHTLQPTALINELYLRLVGRERVQWKNRSQFMGFAAQTMRRILVDHARRKSAAKRGAGAVEVPLDEKLGIETTSTAVDVIALDRALKTLASMDARQARVVELRYFAGLTLTEVAETLGVGIATVARDWNLARAWLYRELTRR